MKKKVKIKRAVFVFLGLGLTGWLGWAGVSAITDLKTMLGSAFWAWTVIIFCWFSWLVAIGVVVNAFWVKRRDTE